MTKKKDSYLILLCVLLSTFSIYAQQIKKVSLGTGKKNCKVTSFVQDERGNMWLGTNLGLYKHNGIEHTLFDINNGLVLNSITSMCLGKDSTLWIGHENGRISILKNNVISAFNLKDTNDTNPINSILCDSKGNVWIGSYGSGVYHYKDGNISKFDSEKGLSDDFIYTIYEAKSGEIWMGTDAGICIVNPATLPAATSFSTLSMKNGLYDNIVKKIKQGNDGNIYIAMQDSGVCYYNLKLKKFEKHACFDNWSFGTINDLFIDFNNLCWIATQKFGVVKFPLSNNVNEVPEVISLNSGFTSENVLALVNDLEENVWMGTANEAILYSRSHTQVLSMKDGLPSNKIYAFLIDQAGNYWISSDAGLTKLRYTHDGKPEVQNFFTKKNAKAMQIVCIYEDRDNILWLGTYGNGVYRLDAKTGNYTLYTTANGIANDNVMSITQDKQGNIWLATLGGGVSRMKWDAGNISVSNFGEHDGLGNNYVYEVFRDRKDRLWFATDGGGISTFNGTYFKSYNKGKLKSSVVYSISDDTNGNIWFSNAEAGIYKFDGTKFTLYSSKDGIRDLAPAALSNGYDNDMVLVHNMGIDVFNEQLNDKIRYYAFSDNEEEFEPSLNASFRDDKGNIWIGTDKGLVQFCSKLDSVDLISPKLSIVNLKLNLNDYSLTAESDFNYKQNHLVFDFLGVYHKNPLKVKYKYMLKGNDEDWSFETETRFASYTNLPPGEYTFMVVASNGSGKWSVPAEYHFSINPPFWKRWWFILLSLITISTTIYFVFKYRMRKIEEEKEILEMKVTERTAEVVEQKKIIEHKNKDITDSINYAKRIQRAMLPDNHAVDRILPNSFIYFEPKDIVSGDFYFLTEVKNGVDDALIVAAVDCTGHGVPGGFMSMIGNSLLNQIIKEKKITEPGEILNNLHVGVRSALRQDDEAQHFDTKTRDGMDVALCKLDIKNRTLEYAGANRSLYLIRKGAAEVEEIKATKLPIGGSQGKDARIFENNKIEVKEGDTIYLFSDGYPDQFGGDEGKKYMTKRLKQTFMQIHTLSLNEQYDFLAKDMKEWMGSIEQIDDMLIIGIRF